MPSYVSTARLWDRETVPVGSHSRLYRVGSAGAHCFQWLKEQTAGTLTAVTFRVSAAPITDLEADPTVGNPRFVVATDPQWSFLSLPVDGVGPSSEHPITLAVHAFTGVLVTLDCSIEIPDFSFFATMRAGGS